MQEAVGYSDSEMWALWSSIQDFFSNFKKGQSSSSSDPSSPKAPFVEEIQRIKAAHPEIPHRSFPVQQLKIIEISQAVTRTLLNGIPAYTVIIINECESSYSDIHLSLCEFATTRLINAKIFRKPIVNDCLVNDG
ncbi:hypothetical protein HAX54_030362, partial [Datura stramonium]|nr:hypothetical protein [Datura stramonium]